MISISYWKISIKVKLRREGYVSDNSCILRMLYKKEKEIQSKCDSEN